MSDYATDIDPQHYKTTPRGIGRECITYTRQLGFSQGNSAKYAYRAGEKGPLLRDLGKARWYLEDAIAHIDTYSVDCLPDADLDTIQPTASIRANLFYRIVSGDLIGALDVIAILEGMSAPENVY